MTTPPGRAWNGIGPPTAAFETFEVARVGVVLPYDLAVTICGPHVSIALGLLMVTTCACASAPQLSQNSGPPQPGRAAQGAIACQPPAFVVGNRPPDGVEIRCERPDGTLDGPFVRWYPTGAKRAAGQYRDGHRNGTWTTWWFDGQLRSRAQFSGGRPDGTWETRYSDGALSTRTVYRPDGATAFEAWRENGSRREAGVIRDGERIGTWRFWDDNGQLARTEDFGSSENSQPAAPALTGVDACDRYIADYLRCIDQVLPAPSREPVRKALMQSVDAWTQAASVEETRAQLTRTCTQAYGAMKQSTQAMGCTF